MKLFNISAVLVALGMSFQTSAQCNVEILQQSLSIDCGQTVNLTAFGQPSVPLLTTNFDGGSLGPGWSSSGTALFGNPCGPSLDGTPSAWFGNVPAPRTMTTTGFDISCGAQVCFDFDFAGDENTTDCEDPDQPNEGVFFQYSIDGGANWVDIFYFEPNMANTGGYYGWANYCFPIPPVAWTTNTMFRWHQEVVSGNTFDHWGIDNVSILATDCGFWYDWSNIPGTNDPVAQTVTPGSTTTYQVTYTDGVEVCTDTMTVTVNPWVADATTSAASVACAGCADLDLQILNNNAGSIVDDFDPVENITMWSDIQSGTPNTDCGSMSGNALHFTGTGAERYAQTVPFNTAANCSMLTFSMFMGNNSSGTVCGNSSAGEDVVLEYSNDNGISWTTILTYDEGQWDSNNSWQSFWVPLPPPAQTTNTMLRWRQVAFTQCVNCDSWALDNVSITCDPPPYDYVWTPAGGLSNALIQDPQACPLANTLYTATVTDPATGCTATDTVSIAVGVCPCTINGLTANVSNCNGGGQTFTVSGEFQYIENPGTGTIVVEAINASGTYSQTINPPFNDLVLTNYSIAGIPADGSPLTINVYFSDDLACIATLNEMSPGLPSVLAVNGGGNFCPADPVINVTVDVDGVAPWTLDYTLNGAPMTANGTATTFDLGTTPGEYIITGLADSACSISTADTVMISINAEPTVVNVAAGGTYCPLDTIGNILVEVTGTGPWTIDYTLDGAPQSANGTNSPVDLGTAEGVYVITAITDASCSVPANGNATIVLNPLPQVDAGADFVNCDGDQVTLTAVGNALSYSWNNGITDGVAFVPTQTLTYTVTATDNIGCTNVDSITVTHEPLPEPSFVASEVAGCEPMQVIFTNTASGSFADCQWIFGDGNSTVGCGDVMNEYMNGGTYDVSLTLTSINGCTNSVTYPDFIYVEHNPSASFVPSTYSVLSLDTEVSFENTTIGAVNYVWDFGDGDSATVINPTHEFPGDQTSGYIVTLYAYSPIGCPDSVSVVIQVNEEIIFYMPNTFTPDGDEFNQDFQPVFTAGFDPHDFNLKLFNRWGQIVWESNDATVAWDGTFKGEMVPDGTYTWVVEFKTIASDERMTATGHVNIIR